jgi:thymidylate synthase (FAD)
MEITLLESCASDLQVVNGARVSLGQRSKSVGKKEEALIRFLMSPPSGLMHSSPFRHGYFEFHIEAPIFVMRQWMRHNAGHNYNEKSGRYTELSRKFYYPAKKVVRTQRGRPGRYKFHPVYGWKNRLVKPLLWLSYNLGYLTYRILSKMGIAKELARIVLPVATYTEVIWSCNPLALMNFLDLRMHAAAQHEINHLAAAVFDEFSMVMPLTSYAYLMKRDGQT